MQTPLPEAEYVPATHLVQAELPTVAATVPAGHGKQVELAASAAKEPTGQMEHDVRP